MKDKKRRDISEADIEEVLKLLTKNSKPGFVMLQGCKEKGVVKRTEFDLNLCSDIECESCREFKK